MLELLSYAIYRLRSIKGVDFPFKPVDHQIETEGLAKLAKIAGYQVYGLPNYIVWHFDTSEKAGNMNETSKWFWPMILFLAAFVGAFSIRHRKWILHHLPSFSLLYFRRSSKIRHY